jgi:hypothetical protein
MSPAPVAVTPAPLSNQCPLFERCDRLRRNQSGGNRHGKWQPTLSMPAEVEPAVAVSVLARLARLQPDLQSNSSVEAVGLRARSARASPEAIVSSFRVSGAVIFALPLPVSSKGAGHSHRPSSSVSSDMVQVTYTILGITLHNVRYNVLNRGFPTLLLVGNFPGLPKLPNSAILPGALAFL